MSPVAAPADRRFRRAHVKPMRRRKLRALLIPAARNIFVAVVAAYGLYQGGIVAAHARALNIDRIVVRGNARLSSQDVLALLGGLRGENLVWTDLEVWRRRLTASPWVKDAALRRSLPSTVEVVLSERAPMAIARIDGDLYLVDDRGIVIDRYGPQYSDLDLPIVDGLGAVAGEEGPATDDVRAELTARLITALGAKPELAKRLSQVDVSNAHNASVILTGDRALIYVGDDRFLQRLESYIELAAALRERVPDIDYVDLRFDDRIYVRPAGKTGKNGAVAIPR